MEEGRTHLWVHAVLGVGSWRDHSLSWGRQSKHLSLAMWACHPASSQGRQEAGYSWNWSSKPVTTDLLSTYASESPCPKDSTAHIIPQAGDPVLRTWACGNHFRCESSQPGTALAFLGPDNSNLRQWGGFPRQISLQAFIVTETFTSFHFVFLELEYVFYVSY